MARFADLPLLDPYDIYQRLMDYWDDVMQDDVYLIASDGWLEAARPRKIVADKTKKPKETPDLTIKRQKYKMDLVPPALIVRCYFAKEQENIERLQIIKEAASRRLAEFIDDNIGEGGLLEEVVNDKRKITKTSVKNRFGAIPDPEQDEEGHALINCFTLMEAESKASKAVREAKAALDQKVLGTYAALDETEIKTLVIEEKWFACISADIHSALGDQGHQLGARVRNLTDRYTKTLLQMEREVEVFNARLVEHLQIMGLKWTE